MARSTGSSHRTVRLLAAMLVLAPAAAQAGREIMLDVPGSSYSNNGQAWGNYLPSTTFSNTLGGVLIGTSETISNDGTVQYPALFSFSILKLPSGNYVLDPSNLTGNAQSAIGINVGQIDSKIFDPSVVNDFDFTNNIHPYDAARYNFNDVCLNNACAGGSLTFQMIDIHLSPTVDVLEFNYAVGRFPVGATAGFTAGPYSASFTPTAPFGPAFCLNNGVQSTFTSIQSCLGTTAVVPEPEVPALLALGTIGLAIGLRRRKSTRRR